jgi:hypothetical protein
MWMPTIYRLLGIIGLILLIIVIYQVRDLFGVFRSETYDDSQVTCLAAIMRADTYGEETDQRARAQELVADVANRVHKKTGLGYCEILQSAATFYPEGWKHGVLFTGRYAEFISKSARYAGSPWAEALERAKKNIGEPDPERCATKYVRIEQRYAWVTDETKAAQQIEKIMREEKTGPNLRTRFFCAL